MDRLLVAAPLSTIGVIGHVDSVSKNFAKTASNKMTLIFAMVFFPTYPTPFQGPHLRAQVRL